MTIELEGCLNFRDLGGYETRFGTVVRHRCLYRAGELCSLTDRDLDVMTGVGVGVVLDLRNEHERMAKPTRIPPGAKLIERTSPSPQGTPGPTLEEAIVAGTLPQRNDEMVAAMNVMLLDRIAQELKILLETAVDAPRRPVVFHCVAGKDRTGVAAAVLLGVLGVGDEAICADYELTNTCFAEPRLRAVRPLLDEHGIDADMVRALVEVRGANLQVALDHVRDRWGGFDEYAVAGLGVDPALPEQLRRALTYNRS